MEFTGNGFFEFKDENHAKNHIQYLLRTEEDQRHTNEYTKENIVFLMDDMDAEQYFTFPEALEDRKSFEKIYLGLVDDVSFKNLAMGRYEWKDPDVYTFTDEMVHKVFAMGRRIEAGIGSVTLAVAHLDQRENYVHVHFLVMPYELEGKGET